MIDLRLAEPFVLLAEELHFGRTASRLAVAQPALSQQIRRLEDQLGRDLFVRSSRHVELTAFGERVLPLAQAIVSAARRIEARVDAPRAVLRIAISGNNSVFVQQWLDAYAADHEELALSTRLTVERELRLEPESFDLMIMSAGSEPPSWPSPYTSRILQVAESGLVMRDDHRLASEPVVELAELSGERLLLFERALAPTIFDHLATSINAGGGLEIVERPVGTSQAQQAMQAWVRAGGGLTANTKAWFASTQPSRLAYRVTWPIVWIGLWATFRDPPSPDVAALVAYLAEQMASP